MTLHTQYYLAKHTHYYLAKTSHSDTLIKPRSSDTSFFTYYHTEYPAVFLVTLSLSSTGFAVKRSNYRKYKPTQTKWKCLKTALSPLILFFSSTTFSRNSNILYQRYSLTYAFISTACQPSLVINLFWQVPISPRTIFLKMLRAITPSQ